MTYSINTQTLAWSAAGISFLLVLALLRWRGERSVNLSRRAALGWSVAWLVVWSVEYWAFGPASFILFGDEAGVVLPEVMEILRNPNVFPYAHAINGGADLIGQLPIGVQYVSLEMFLFQLLPPWVAIAVHKIMVTAIALGGMALLARRVTGVDRALAIALGCAYTVSHTYLTTTTLAHGLGYALIPLAIYVVAVRADAKHYFGPVVALAALHAASSSVTHSFLSFGPALVAGGLLLNPRRWTRIALALLIIFLFEIANWSEYLNAASQMAADSARLANRLDRLPLGEVPQLIWDRFQMKFGILGLPAMVLAIVAAFFTRSTWRWRGSAILIGLLIAGPLMRVIPWQSLHLVPLASIQWTYINYAIPPLLLLVIAQTARHERARHWWLAFSGAAALSLMADIKVFEAVDLFGRGGQATLTRVPNLATRPWASSEPFRVVAVPYRFVPGYVHAYGLDSSDGYLILVSRARAEFWRVATRITDDDLGEGRQLIDNMLYTFNNASLDPRCCVSIDAPRYADLDLLGMVNTRYILSYVPLTGGGLRKVSGPEDWTIGRRERPFRQKLVEDWNALFEPGDIYVYELPRVLPRAYFAASVENMNANGDSDSFYAAVAAAAHDRKIWVPAGADELQPIVDARVLSISESRGSITATVSAPAGGVLVINYNYTPFWQADVDGISVPIIQANGVQMALPIPPGGKEVTLRYRRPGIAERLGLAETAR